MSDKDDNVGLGEAATRFLANLPATERGGSQREINKFVRWYGRERPFTGLTAPEVANYAERLSQSDTHYSGKLELIRSFLVYARKKGWSQDNLATHLKARKTRTKVRSSSEKTVRKPVTLTQQGYDELVAELTALKNQRSQAIEEMRQAAADKDFRENAPLDAAKERRGQIEGRIMELEETLNSAGVIDGKRDDTPRINVGDSIVLQDLASGEELRYTLVSSREVDPSRGKISGASPIGKAAIGKIQGEVVEITVPAGRLRYQIKHIER